MRIANQAHRLDAHSFTMPRQLFVSLLPAHIDEPRLENNLAVVIDVLRASTTACAALSQGAKRIIPFASIEDARRFASRLTESGETPLLCGERGCIRIEGFDLGNSPREYTPEAVANRTLLFTTTNGTRGLMAVAKSRWSAMGCFANLSAIVDRLAREQGDVHLVAAGTDGRITLEDALAAGAIAQALRDRQPTLELANDEAHISLTLNNQYNTPELRLQALAQSTGGQNLRRLGLDSEIAFCAQLDTYPIVPVLENSALTADTPLAGDQPGADWSI